MKEEDLGKSSGGKWELKNVTNWATAFLNTTQNTTEEGALQSHNDYLELPSKWPWKSQSPQLNDGSAYNFLTLLWEEVIQIQ